MNQQKDPAPIRKMGKTMILQFTDYEIKILLKHMQIYSTSELEKCQLELQFYQIGKDKNDG